MPGAAGASGETVNTPVTAGRCLYRAERAYVDDAGIGHDVLHLYATGHTTTGTPMDEWDWPHGLDLWDLVDLGDQGQVLIDPAPFDEQWTGKPAQVIGLRPGERPPSSGVMAHGELHVACESRCTAPGAEDRQALAALRDARHQALAARARLTGLQAEYDQVSAQVQDLLAEDLRRDLDED